MQLDTFFHVWSDCFASSEYLKMHSEGYNKPQNRPEATATLESLPSCKFTGTDIIIHASK